MSEHDCPFPGNCAACVTRWWEERGDAPTEPIPMIRPDMQFFRGLRFALALSIGAWVALWVFVRGVFG